MIYSHLYFEKRKVLHLVTKSAMTNPYLVDLFQPSRTFVKEARFYSSVIPAIERFEVESNVELRDRLDLFVKCVGSRISLDSGMLHIFCRAGCASSRVQSVVLTF